jgi:threonine dehydratase
LIPLEEIRRARERIEGTVVRTPLVRLETPDAAAEVYLKLECLQPIGSFKLRGALNAIEQSAPEALADGVLTASAGNMAQGVAWAARAKGIPAAAIVPDTAPQAKLAALERLGCRTVHVPFERWWRVMEERAFEDEPGLFVHPFDDEAVMAGNGTIGLELLEDLPDPDIVLIPWGGGGLSSGIASAVRALRPETRVYAVEVETAAPLAASFAAGTPAVVEYRPSFVDGIGSSTLFPRFWVLARELLEGSLTASLDEIAAAVRLLVERARVVAEGAGACPLAVALSGRAGSGKIVCVVSGGNIDSAKLATILSGRTP